MKYLYFNSEYIFTDGSKNDSKAVAGTYSKDALRVMKDIYVIQCKHYI